MSRVFLLIVWGLLYAGACARTPAPLPKAPPPPSAETLAQEAALFDAVDNADQLRFADTVEVAVEVWQEGKKKPVPGLALSVSPGDHAAKTDAQGRATIGRLPAGDYRLGLADARYGLLETRLLPAEKKDLQVFRVSVEELGSGMAEIVVHGSKFRWCGALGEVCGVPITNKDRLHVVIDGFLRGLPH